MRTRRLNGDYYFINGSVVRAVDDVVLKEEGDGAHEAKGQGRQDFKMADPLLELDHSVLIKTLRI